MKNLRNITRKEFEEFVNETVEDFLWNDRRINKWIELEHEIGYEQINLIEDLARCKRAHNQNIEQLVVAYNAMGYEVGE